MLVLIFDYLFFYKYNYIQLVTFSLSELYCWMLSSLNMTRRKRP